MFTDETPGSVTVPSRWRESRQSAQETRSSQTRALHNSESGVQTVCSSSSSTQTEPQQQQQQQQQQQLSQPPSTQTEPPGLLDFLQRVEALMVTQLERNSRSHAFHDYQPYWEDNSQQVSRLHSLLHPSAQDKGLHVTCVSWSCTGSVVVCGYGRMDEGDWSTEGSYVCGWNVDRGGLRSRQAHLIIDVPTAVTALCCHPTRPAIIAGGLYSGEVVVWDSSRTQDPVLAQTGLSAQSHREPVYQVVWVPLQKKGEFGVVSGCSGGRVLLWTLDSDQGLLVLTAAYELMRQQIPQRGSNKARGSSRVGVTSLAVSPWDTDTFLVGSEDGLLLRCSFSSQTLAATSSSSSSSSSQDPRERLRAPAVFSFTPHSGPVHSIHCSPFHRNLFIVGGTQGVVVLYSLLQADPLLVLRVSDCYVFMVQFSPSRPLLLAAATGHGEVHIFDLGRRSLRPAFILERGGGGGAATCLAFNRSNVGLMAVGSSDGSVSVWQLSGELTDQNPRESSQLELIANQVAE